MDENEKDLEDEESILAKLKWYGNHAVVWFSHQSIIVKIFSYILLMVCVGIVVFLLRAKPQTHTDGTPTTQSNSEPENKKQQSNPNVATNAFPKSLANSLKGRSDQQNNALAFQSGPDSSSLSSGNTSGQNGKSSGS